MNYNSTKIGDLMFAAEGTPAEALERLKDEEQRRITELYMMSQIQGRTTRNERRIAKKLARKKSKRGR